MTPLRDHSAPTPPPGRPPAGRRHVVFRMGGVECAVDARHVRRSIPAPLTLGPEVVVQGQAYPVVDLRALFRPPTPEPGRLILLVASAGGRAGLLVDALTDLLLIEDGAIAPLPELFGGIERQWLEGQARLGSRVVVLLRLDAILGAHAVLPARPATAG